MLERVRFSTKDPAALSRELDRLVLSVERELDRIEKQSARRLALSPTVNGRAGVTATTVAAFDMLLPVNSANGSIDILLPAATRADAGRFFLVERLSGANACRLQGGTRVINNNTATVTLPATRAAYLVEWDGIGFWTVDDAI